MNKQKSVFRCTNCAYASVKWLGCCPTCNEWNSFTQENYSISQEKQSSSPAPIEFVSLNQITIEQQTRMCSGIKEWDRVLGGGILPGSLLILTGDPGIGKSTLLLQVADKIAQHYDVIYISSEESLQQVKSRASRFNTTSPKLLFSDDACLENIIHACIQKNPHLVILDSIQNCHLSDNTTAFPGTIAQLREAGFQLMRFTKENNIAVLLTGHITKEGHMAGPKVLEHLVDGVFYLQGEDRWQTRILRSVKNRFGTINEVGFFEMREDGLIEIPNINQQFLSDTSSNPGAALVCCIEGTRPILLELQALCVESKYGVPQRVISGVDHKQVVLIAAILEKHLHLRFSVHDIFFKVSGGFKIKDSSTDLGIALALLSSYFQVPIGPKTVALAEINLTGVIKPTNQIHISIKEIEKFGIETIILSTQQQAKTSCKTLQFRNVYELLQLFPEPT
jgi:DNA repair protein RadA/Sms